MNKFELVDLPKGNFEWKYYPVRPTEYTIVYKGHSVIYTSSYSLQTPLVLHIGDVLLYDGILPEQFIELTRRTSSHPIYAVITTQGQSPQAAHDSSLSPARPEFVG